MQSLNNNKEIQQIFNFPTKIESTFIYYFITVNIESSHFNNKNQNKM